MKSNQDAICTHDHTKARLLRAHYPLAAGQLRAPCRIWSLRGLRANRAGGR